MSEFTGTTLEKIAEAFAGPEWPIFQSVESIENGFQIECRIEDRTRWFEGHFDNQPVLPGVAQVHWAGELAKFLFDLSSESFCGMDNIKFHNSILPNADVTLNVVFDGDKGSVKFRYNSMDSLHSEGSLRFKRAGS